MCYNGDVKEKTKYAKTSTVHQRFNLLINKFYHIFWSVEQIQNVKIQKVIMTTKKEWCFHQNVHRVIVKNHDLSKEKEEAGGLLTSLGLKTDISSKIPLLGHIYFYSIKWIKIINKFLLAGGKFIVVDNLLKTKK